MITTIQTLQEYCRTRLSPNFFMREFLHSEIAEIEGIANVPVDPDLAILAGQGLRAKREELHATYMGY